MFGIPFSDVLQPPKTEGIDHDENNSNGQPGCQACIRRENEYDIGKIWSRLDYSMRGVYVYINHEGFLVTVLVSYRNRLSEIGHEGAIATPDE